MYQFVLRRVLLSIPTLLIVSFLVFSMIRLNPDSVVAARLGEVLLLRGLTVGAIDVAGLDQAGRRRRDDAARLAEDAAADEIVDIAMRRHQADAEAFGEILDAQRSLSHDRLGDQLPAHQLAGVPAVARHRFR